MSQVHVLCIIFNHLLVPQDVPYSSGLSGCYFLKMHFPASDDSCLFRGYSRLFWVYRDFSREQHP